MGEDEPLVPAGGGCAARRVGEWVTSCGVSCVCKLDGLESVGRHKPQGGYVYFHLAPIVCELRDAHSLVSGIVNNNRA